MTSNAKHIFLLGLPASGKSTLGKRLSERMGRGYLDTDDWIVQREGMSVSDIFLTKGALYFRSCEAEAIGYLAEIMHPMVVATGGGLPCYHNNMERMNALGTTIYLDVKLDLLAKRILPKGRPMFENVSKEDIQKRLNRLRSERDSIYNQSQHRLKLEVEDEEEILDRVLRIVQ